MSDIMQTELIQIGGAGSAGLAAAITLAKAGRRVLVHEMQSEVGNRFDGDFQGLENWSAQQDVLDQLRELGITNAGFELRREMSDKYRQINKYIELLAPNLS